MRSVNKEIKNAVVIDLFCGIGGMTHGFVKEGFNVIAGIDNDKSCKYGYEYNNPAKFIHKKIEDVDASRIEELYGDTKNRKILIGCAPCQKFSTLNLGSINEEAFIPLRKFSELIQKVKPEIVSMENVRRLVKQPIFKEFLINLEKCNYWVWYDIIDASCYGVPQKRKRLVLLASRLGPISLCKETHKNRKRTVGSVIKKFSVIGDGEVDPKDRYHRTRKLNALNKKRMKATTMNGGGIKDWDDELKLDCHKKETGRTYKSTVYGRMKWDEPAPTMTTQCIGFGNGRFGHPEQHRAISLREAAAFQTFPIGYKFIDPKDEIKLGEIAKFIGNAVPVRLGQIIARSIKKHLLAV